jgi:hypothetical protein
MSNSSHFFKQAEGGMSIKYRCRSGGVSQPTFFKWRAKFAGMEASVSSNYEYWNPRTPSSRSF